MKSKKIKIPQYLVRGKHRDYAVLVFPKKKWLCAFYEDFDERYEIDGDPAAYQQVKYALAALIANPGKIAYFPIYDPHSVYEDENYDAVLTRPELQFRQSEWVNLYHQLDKAHRIKNFELHYEPKKLCEHYKKFSQDKGKVCELWKRKDRREERLLGNTVFFSLHRETCYAYHDSIIDTEQLVLDGYGDRMFADIIGEIGYMITPGLKRKINRRIRKEREQKMQMENDF